MNERFEITPHEGRAIMLALAVSAEGSLYTDPEIAATTEALYQRLQRWAALQELIRGEEGER